MITLALILITTLSMEKPAPTAEYCAQVRAFVRSQGGSLETAEREARARGASDAQIAEARRCYERRA